MLKIDTFTEHTQLFIHLFIHLSKFILVNPICGVRDISHKVFCRMKNYKIVFIKFDEFILIDFVIEIELMFFA